MPRLVPPNLKEVVEVVEVEVQEVEEVEAQPKQVKSKLNWKLIPLDPLQPRLQPHLVVEEEAEEEIEPLEVLPEVPPELEAVPNLNFRLHQHKKALVQAETLFKMLLPGKVKKANWIVLPFQVVVKEML